MGEKLNESDFVVTINGEKIDSLQSFKINLKKEKEIEREEDIELINGKNMILFNREFTITLKDVEVEKEFLGKFFPCYTKFKIVGTAYKLPRGNKLPKKKRIRNKWLKKYQEIFEFNDCYIKDSFY